MAISAAIHAAWFFAQGRSKNALFANPLLRQTALLPTIERTYLIPETLTGFINVSSVYCL
jgi:hypothetical protein